MVAHKIRSWDSEVWLISKSPKKDKASNDDLDLLNVRIKLFLPLGEVALPLYQRASEKKAMPPLHITSYSLSARYAHVSSFIPYQVEFSEQGSPSFMRQFGPWTCIKSGLHALPERLLAIALCVSQAGLEMAWQFA
ncbi:hypothetical protein VNO77_02572 [Canavalia gladiata]|uniref:Uncharacterized protein n=1 Tax=Canavalia gladiata TaxID=3824 RepID=A0AAN9MVA9_CANGL